MGRLLTFAVRKIWPLGPFGNSQYFRKEKSGATTLKTFFS
jgi:hypothetical protein